MAVFDCAIVDPLFSILDALPQEGEWDNGSRSLFSSLLQVFFYVAHPVFWVFFPC